MKTKVGSYKDLTVWQKSILLCEEVYKITEDFPKHELYGLTSQIRRSCVAIPSNIAEGKLRGHEAELVQFLRIAFASGAELETQLLIARNIGYLKNEDFGRVSPQLEEIMKMLNSFITSLFKARA